MAKTRTRKARKPRRRNVDGTFYGGKFHPYRSSKGYSRTLAGDNESAVEKALKKRSATRTRKRKK